MSNILVGFTDVASIKLSPSKYQALVDKRVDPGSTANDKSVN